MFTYARLILGRGWRFRHRDDNVISHSRFDWCSFSSKGRFVARGVHDLEDTKIGRNSVSHFDEDGVTGDYFRAVTTLVRAAAVRLAFTNLGMTEVLPFLKAVALGDDSALNEFVR